MEIDFKNKWNCNIRGWLKSSECSTAELSNFLKISAKDYETRQEFIDRSKPKDKKHFFEKSDRRGENPKDIYVDGKLIENKDDFKKIVKKYFDLIV